LPKDSNIPATIYQAGLATSAAITFFDPVVIGSRTFADGGLGANNPVDEIEGEAANIWCPESADLKPLVKCFISIGTGNPGLKAFDDNIVKFLSKTVAGIATETKRQRRNLSRDGGSISTKTGTSDSMSIRVCRTLALTNIEKRERWSRQRNGIWFIKLRKIVSEIVYRI
jgi:predicted acylesterase/phospholipase RssA